MKAVLLNKECCHCYLPAVSLPRQGGFALSSPSPAQPSPATAVWPGVPAAWGRFAEQLCWGVAELSLAQPEGSSWPCNRCTSFLQVGGNGVKWLSQFGRAGTRHLFRGSLRVMQPDAPEGDLLIALRLCGLRINVAKSKVTWCSR